MQLTTKPSGIAVSTLAASNPPTSFFMRKTICVHFITRTGVQTTVEARVGNSLMEAATANDIDGVAADCGGLMTCSTCHVFVQDDFASRLAPPDAEELGMLAFTATPQQSNSRLSCQIALSEALDGITVTLPASQY